MTSSKLPSELPEQPSQRLAQTFDYAALDMETRIVVQQYTTEIKQRVQDIAKITWEIGQKLFEIRECLGYGLFCSWLESEFQWSSRTAYNYINVFESFTFATLAKVEVATAALYRLAAASTPQEARTEAIERALGGEKITESKAKALIKQYKQPAAPKIIKQVTLDVAAETVEEELTFSTKLNSPSIDEEAFAFNPELSVEGVESCPSSTEQFEQELLGKEVHTESPLPEMSKSNLTGQMVNKPTDAKNKRENKMERQQVNDIYKNLRANISYINQENIFEEIDLEDLKSLEEEISLLVKRKEASVNKHYNSNYSNN